MTKEEILRLKTEVVLGKNINLRVATENDAEFILDLRLNPLLNKYISQTNPSIEKQRCWIRNSFEKTNDFHFIIESKEGKPYGTIAIYDIDYESGVAVWGRWVIKHGSFVFVSVESTILVLYFAFTKLGLKKLTGGANNKNIQVVNFHKIYASISFADENYTWFFVEESNYLKILRTFKNFHNIQFKQ
jgi:RimJ/RimL family protein N-acetyltransferase